MKMNILKKSLMIVTIMIMILTTNFSSYAIAIQSGLNSEEETNQEEQNEDSSDKEIEREESMSDKTTKSDKNKEEEEIEKAKKTEKSEKEAKAKVEKKKKVMDKAEKEKAKQEKLAKEKKEKEKAKQEKLTNEKEEKAKQEKLAKEKEENKKAKQEKLTKEKEENEKVEQEKLAKEKENKAVILTFEVDFIKITVSAEPGVLSKDTELSVKAIKDKDTENYLEAINENQGTSLEELKAFDIKLLDTDGNEIQPKGQVEVSFDGLDINDNEDTVAYYLDSALEKSDFKTKQSRSEIEIDELKSKQKNKKVSFHTDHFSIYGVGTKARGIYEFYVDDVEVDTQIVLNNEKLKNPKTPETSEGKKFIGWYIAGESDPIDFNKNITVSQNKTYKVNAKFEEINYVYFVYNDNIVGTKEVKPDEVTDDKDIPLVILEEGKALSHWSETKNGEAFDFNKKITKNTTLYAVLKDSWKVSFNTQGGNLLLPKYIENGERLGVVDNPVRAGYKFKTWNTKANGTGQNYDSNKVINGPVSLYAIWEAQTTEYSIVYWQENADDNEYTYKESDTGQGLSGSKITLPSNKISNNRYPYFTYKEYDTGKTIKGDGSTVINVYYSRNEYTMKFDLNKRYSKLNIGGRTYSGTQYSFTAKYEADISNLWPTATNISDVGRDQFYGWTGIGSSTLVSKRLKLTSDLIPNRGDTNTIKGSWRNDLKEYTLHYMIESLTDSGDKKYNGIWYVEDPAYNQIANSTGNWSAKTLPGVSNVGKGSESGRNEYFYYDRNVYDLEFYNPTSKLEKKSEIKYGSSIEDKNYTPKKPTGVKEDYVFKGWYTNSEGLGDPYDFTDETMPENNLALYAKWAPLTNTVSVEYHETQDASGELKSIDDIEREDFISESQMTKQTPEGLSEDNFAGWYWYIDGTFAPFDFDTPIDKNGYVLYPVWKELIYEVNYNPGEGSGTVPKDEKKYIQGTTAKVLAPTNLNPPKDKFFLGWKTDSSNKFYYPNNKVVVTGNITLTAQWGDKVPNTKLTYYPNGGIGEAKLFEGLKNNATHKVLKGKTYTRAGYDFMSWNTKANGSGESFQPAEEIIVGNAPQIPNELYAQWGKKIIVTAKDREKVYDGTALEKNEATVKDLLPGHTMTDVKVTGSQTSIGSSANVASEAKIKDADGNDVTGEYSITYEDGTLTVTSNIGSLEITKIDGNTGDIITTGAEFELKDKTGETIIATGKTDKNGKIEFKDLPFGSYKLVETKAPIADNGKAYRLLTKPIDVEIVEPDELKELTVENYKSGWHLPDTGGMGTTLFFLTGIIFMGIAFLFFKRKKA